MYNETTPQQVRRGVPARKKRRVFLWIFLAIQVLFIVWLVTGLATVHPGPSAADLSQGCYSHHWWRKISLCKPHRSNGDFCHISRVCYSCD